MGRHRISPLAGLLVLVTVRVLGPHAAFGAPLPPPVDRGPFAGSRTVSSYAHWVADTETSSQAIGERRGCAAADRSPRGVIVLAFGRQRPGGATGFSHTVRPAAVLAAAAHGFAVGLARCGDGPYLLALATSNYRSGEHAETGAADGAAWVDLVADAAARSVDSAGKVTVAGGSDIEPGWGPARYATDWVDAFTASGLPYVFIGSADGCAWADGQAGCANGWTAQQVAHAAWPSTASFPLPQVYDHRGRMAAQWARLSTLADRRLLGVLVQNDACRGADNVNCPQLDNTAQEALDQINARLERPVDVASDISWR